MNVESSEPIPLFKLDAFESYQNYGTEYSKGMTSHVIEYCVRYGLHQDFIPNFRDHLGEINLVISGAESFPRSPYGHENDVLLSVLRAPNENVADPDEEMKYQRFLIISEDEVKRRAEILDNIINWDEGQNTETESVEGQADKNDTKPRFAVIEGNGNATAKLVGAAVDWIYYEQALIALNNACYMQQHFPKYVSDFNGQSPFYRTEYTMSANYMRLHEEFTLSVESDFRNLRNGFGLVLLHDALLARGVAASSEEADTIISRLRRNEPSAYRFQEITDRFTAMEPNHDIRKQIAEFALSVYDPDITVDDEDITKQ